MEKRKLCLDIGERRIGIAVSDGLNMCAHAQPAVSAQPADKALAAIKALAAQYDTGEIVIGNPLHMAGHESAGSEVCRQWAKTLEKEIPDTHVTLRDERLSTVAAQRTLMEAGISEKKARHIKDSMAAQWILQGYLDEQRQKANQ